MALTDTVSKLPCAADATSCDWREGVRDGLEEVGMIPLVSCCWYVPLGEREGGREGEREMHEIVVHTCTYLQADQ